MLQWYVDGLPMYTVHGVLHDTAEEAHKIKQIIICNIMLFFSICMHHPAPILIIMYLAWCFNMEFKASGSF